MPITLDSGAFVDGPNDCHQSAGRTYGRLRYVSGAILYEILANRFHADGDRLFAHFVNRPLPAYADNPTGAMIGLRALAKHPSDCDGEG
jgi:hypothetical protein